MKYELSIPKDLNLKELLCVKRKTRKKQNKKRTYKRSVLCRCGVVCCYSFVSMYLNCKKRKEKKEIILRIVYFIIYIVNETRRVLLRSVAKGKEKAKETPTNEVTIKQEKKLL